MPQLVSSLDVLSAAMKRSEGAKLSSEAYASVREEILSGRLQIGEAVSRNRPHRDLADGLCQQDPDIAAEAMRKHVQTSLQRTLVRLSEYFQLRDKTGKRFIRKRKVLPQEGG